jgi:hypothetical protein
MHSEDHENENNLLYVSDFVISRSLIEDAMSEKMTQIDANFAYDHHSQSSSQGESSFALNFFRFNSFQLHVLFFVI